MKGIRYPFHLCSGDEVFNMLLKVAIDKKIVQGLEIGKDRVSTPHLQFAVDTHFGS